MGSCTAILPLFEILLQLSVAFGYLPLAKLITQSCPNYRFEDGGQHATGQQHLSRSPVPPIQIEARRSRRGQGLAAKLARLIYRMLRYGMKYVDQGAKFYEAQHRNLQVKHLKRKAAKLGYQLIQAPAT